MGKSKKPFIDKKNASTYHLLHRSQRDVAGAEDGEVETGVILWPSPSNNEATDRKVLTGSKRGEGEGEDSALGVWKEELSRAGLVDEYDYDQHLKPITGGGKFLDADGANREMNPLLDARSKDVQEPLTKEVERQLESIALSADCFDDDLAEALFGDFEEGDFEELNDDFVLDAAKEPDVDDGDGGFDFAAHINDLIKKAKMESDSSDGLHTVHEHARQDQQFFANVNPLHGHDEYSDENNFQLNESEGPGAVPKLSDASERALCEKFNETLAEYDSDELGDIYEEEITGPRSMEGDKQVEAALDDFLQEKKDDIFIKGTRHYMEGNNVGGSGYAVLVGTQMVPGKDLDNTGSNGDERPISEVLADAKDILSNPLAAPPAEEVFIDGKSYFAEKMQNPWDCESILTTYSNLDNNPVTIGAGGRRRRRKQGNAGGPASLHDQDSVQQIRLSEKTGLPVGVLPRVETEEYGDDTFVSVNKGEARKKTETAKEKKARKLQIKKERQLSRMQKKMMKEAFNTQFSKRTSEVMADDVGGRTVFRF